MEPNTDNCTKCGKPRSGTKGATITQWVSVCQCDALAFSDLSSQNAEKVELQVCQTCGKRVEEKRAGSLTQWIFRDSSCRCDFPQITMAPSAPATAPTPVVLRRLSQDADDHDIGIEFDPIVEEVFQPRSVNKNPIALKTAVLIAGVLGALSIGAVILTAMTPPAEKFDATEGKASIYSSTIEYELAERAPPEVIGSIGVKLNGTKIIEAQRFAPAAAAGVVAGDEILSIDGDSVVKGLNTDSVSRKLLGACRSPLSLVVLRGQKEVTLNVTRSEDIYEGITDHLTAKQYFELGTEAKFAGLPNRSRLAFTLAMEHGDTAMKKLAQQEIRCELPKDFVPFEAQFLNNEAHNLMAAEAYKSVVVLLKECIEKYPKFEWPYLNLALFYYASDKLDRCEEQLQKVLLLNPNLTRPWVALSILKERQDDTVEAERCMNKALSLDPGALEEKTQLLGVLDVRERVYNNSAFKRTLKDTRLRDKEILKRQQKRKLKEMRLRQDPDG